MSDRLSTPDPSWDDLLSDLGTGRVGAYRVVRGRIREGVSEGELEEVEAWADQFHIHQTGSGADLVAVRREEPEPATRPLLHLFLFLAAFASAVVAGGFLAGKDVLNTHFTQVVGVWLPLPTGFRGQDAVAGLPFAISFMGILLGHELGHYFLARRHGVPVSPPYFIPFPPYFSLVGTLGAFIRLRGPMIRRVALFDVGVAGPLASFALSVPLLLVGLQMSEVIPDAGTGLYPFLVRFLDQPVQIGTNAVLQSAAYLMVPDFEVGRSVLLHPLAFAGWLGIFVTALNLLPLGQLDGGHILYAIAGTRQRTLGLAFVLLLLPLGFVWWGWWLWGAVALALGRGRVAHPPLLMEQVPLGKGRTRVGWAAMILFVLSFSPAPLRM